MARPVTRLVGVALMAMGVIVLAMAWLQRMGIPAAMSPIMAVEQQPASPTSFPVTYTPTPAPIMAAATGARIPLWQGRARFGASVSAGAITPGG